MTERIVCLTGQGMSLLSAGQPIPLPSEWIARFEKNMDELENRYAWRSQGAGAQFTQSTNPYAGASREQAVISSFCPFEDKLLYSVNYGERCGLYLMDVDSPGRGEALVFSQMNQLIDGLDVCGEKIALSVSSPSGRSSIALMPRESADISLITEGDVLDTDPSFSRDGRSIYYASAGLGRSESGQLLAVGPSAILRLDMESGTLSDLPADEAYDYFQPREGTDGMLYCLRKPHEKPVQQKKGNPLTAALDFFRGITLIGRLLSGKVTPVDPEKLARSSGRPGRAMKNKPAEEIPADEPSLASFKNWALVRLNDSKWEVVRDGAAAFTPVDGGIIFSDGKSILFMPPDGSVQNLAQVGGVIRMAVMP